MTLRTFSFLLPNTAPMPPRPSVWARSCMTDATFTRFSPATPMQRTEDRFSSPASTSSSVDPGVFSPEVAGRQDLAPHPP